MRTENSDNQVPLRKFVLASAYALSPPSLVQTWKNAAAMPDREADTIEDQWWTPAAAVQYLGAYYQMQDTLFSTDVRVVKFSELSSGKEGES